MFPSIFIPKHVHQNSEFLSFDNNNPKTINIAVHTQQVAAHMQQVAVVVLWDTKVGYSPLVVAPFWVAEQLVDT